MNYLTRTPFSFKRLEPLLAVIAGILLSQLISVYAWENTFSMLALLLLPAIMNWSEWRWWPFCVALAYFMTGNLELPGMMVRFFDDPPSTWMIAGAPTLLSLIQSIPFLLYRADRPPLNRALRMLAALLLLTGPGVGFAAWHNPLFVSGAMYPQMGLWGLGVTLLMFSLIAGLGRKDDPVPSRNVFRTFTALLFVFSVWTVWHDLRTPVRPVMLGWYEVDTRLKPGHQRNVNDPLPGKALAEMADHVMTFPEVDVIVFPESVLAPMSPADELELMWLSKRAAQKGVVLLMGETMTLEPDGSAWRNTVSAFGYQQGNRPCDRLFDETPCLLGDKRIGRTLDESRLPMPIGGWRLSGGVPAHPFASDIVRLETRSGTVRMAMSLCFEDLMLWPHRGLLTGKADVLVSMANTWATSGTRGDREQALAAHLLARLAGVPLVRAVNRLPE